MSEAKAANSSSPQMLHLPPGFRFHPTDEELVVDYLAKKAESKLFPIPVIAEVDLYKFNPWELPAKAYFGEKELYFFTPRDRKYPNGARPNRAAGAGYWKATGTDKSIFTSRGRKRVGVKKALVFYDGKAPKGMKTNWIMHEYRLVETSSNKPKSQTSLRLDDWVLCRIYDKKSSAFKVMVPAHRFEPEAEEVGAAPGEESGLDDILASLQDIDCTQLAFPQLGSHESFKNEESLEDLLNSTGDMSNSNISGVFQADYPVETVGFQELLQDAKSFAPEVDNNLDLSNYWSLYPHGSNLTREASPMLKRRIGDVLQQMQSARKRTKFDVEEDDVSSTCTSASKQTQHQFRIF